MNKNAARRAFFASLARLIGIILGASLGSWIAKIGGALSSPGAAILVFVVSFCLIWFAEYERVN